MKKYNSFDSFKSGRDFVTGMDRVDINAAYQMAREKNDPYFTMGVAAGLESRGQLLSSVALIGENKKQITPEMMELYRDSMKTFQPPKIKIKSQWKALFEDEDFSSLIRNQTLNNKYSSRQQEQNII